MNIWYIWVYIESMLITFIVDDNNIVKSTEVYWMDKALKYRARRLLISLFLITTKKNM